MKSPGRADLQDLSVDLFERYKEYLLGDSVHNLQARDASDNVIHTPPWQLVLAYEQAIRKQAFHYMVADGSPMGASWERAWKDPVTKERHFSTPLSLYSKRKPDGNINMPPSRPGRLGSLGHRERGKRAQRVPRGADVGAAPSAATKTGEPICFRYNTEEGCSLANCKFKHICSHCFDRNRNFVGCPKRKPADTDSLPVLRKATSALVGILAYKVITFLQAPAQGDFLIGLRWAERRKVKLGNNLADFSMRAAAATLDLGKACLLLEQPDLGAVAPGLRPSSMWARPSFRAIAGHCNARHVVFHQADFGASYPKPTRLLLRTTQPLLPFMQTGLPEFDEAGFYRGPLPRRATSTRMQPRSGAPFATTGTEQWPSGLCKWVAQSILADFVASSSSTSEGEIQDLEPESTDEDDEQVGDQEKIFRFEPPTNFELPDETRVREAAEDIGGRRSFTTGAFVHGDT
ncbi:unnamed protein product, partial [Symbiodinium sp. CCMP2456]